MLGSYVKHYYLKKPILARIMPITVRPANQVIIILRSSVMISPLLVNMVNNVRI